MSDVKGASKQIMMVWSQREFLGWVAWSQHVTLWRVAWSQHVIPRWVVWRLHVILQWVAWSQHVTLWRVARSQHVIPRWVVLILHVILQRVAWSQHVTLRRVARGGRFFSRGNPPQLNSVDSGMDWVTGLFSYEWHFFYSPNVFSVSQRTRTKLGHGIIKMMQWLHWNPGLLANRALQTKINSKWGTEK